MKIVIFFNEPMIYPEGHNPVGFLRYNVEDCDKAFDTFFNDKKLDKNFIGNFIFVKLEGLDKVMVSDACYEFTKKYAN